jgi:hypothetical protein
VLEEVLARSVGVERFETELFDQGLDSLLTRTHPLAADFDDLAVTNGMVERPSAHTVPSLEHHDVDSLSS